MARCPYVGGLSNPVAYFFWRRERFRIPEGFQRDARGRGAGWARRGRQGDRSGRQGRWCTGLGAWGVGLDRSGVVLGGSGVGLGRCGTRLGGAGVGLGRWCMVLGGSGVGLGGSVVVPVRSVVVLGKGGTRLGGSGAGLGALRMPLAVLGRWLRALGDVPAVRFGSGAASRGRWWRGGIAAGLKVGDAWHVHAESRHPGRTWTDSAGGREGGAWQRPSSCAIRWLRAHVARGAAAGVDLGVVEDSGGVSSLSPRVEEAGAAHMLRAVSSRSMPQRRSVEPEPCRLARQASAVPHAPQVGAFRTRRRQPGQFRTKTPVSSPTRTPLQN